jgi:hypothetical protein
VFTRNQLQQMGLHCLAGAAMVLAARGQWIATGCAARIPVNTGLRINVGAGPPGTYMRVLTFSERWRMSSHWLSVNDKGCASSDKGNAP